MESGAIVFVCGDGEKMEPDVCAEPMSLYRERTGAGAGEALRWIEEMGPAAVMSSMCGPTISDELCRQRVMA